MSLFKKTLQLTTEQGQVNLSTQGGANMKANQLSFSNFPTSQLRQSNQESQQHELLQSVHHKQQQLQQLHQSQSSSKQKAQKSSRQGPKSLTSAPSIPIYKNTHCINKIIQNSKNNLCKNEQKSSDYHNLDSADRQKLKPKEEMKNLKNSFILQRQEKKNFGSLQCVFQDKENIHENILSNIPSNSFIPQDKNIAQNGYPQSIKPIALSTRAKKPVTVSKSLSNNILKSQKTKTEPEIEEQGYFISINDQMCFSSAKSRKRLQNNSTKSCNAPQKSRYEFFSQEDDQEIEPQDHRSKIILSTEACSASQVLLSTEACSQPRSSSEQSLGIGIKPLFFNEEEEVSIKISQFFCQYHPSKKGKYLARWEKNSSSPVCSRCAVELASKGVKIEEVCLESPENEMRRKMMNLLTQIRERRQDQEDCLKQLKAKRDQMSQVYVASSKQIEERFLLAERLLMEQKNKALGEINAAKILTEQKLEESEKVGRTQLEQCDQMACDILLHHEAIINGIELESFRGIINNYNRKAECSRQFFESLSQERVEIVQLKLPQDTLREESRLISSLFEVERVPEVIVYYKPSHEKRQSDIINYMSNNDKVTLEVEELEYNFNTALPLSSTQSLSQNNNRNSQLYCNALGKQDTETYLSPNNRMNKNLLIRSQIQNSSLQSKAQLEASASSNHRNGGLSKSDFGNYTPICSQSIQSNKMKNTSTKSNRSSQFNNDWKIRELPQSQEQEKRENFTSLFQEQFKETTKSKNPNLSNSNERKFNSLLIETSLKNNQANAFRTLFPSSSQIRQNDQMQSHFDQIVQQKDFQQLQQHLHEQQILDEVENPLTQRRYQLDQVAEETPLTQSSIKTSNPASEKYKDILDKIHANQARNTSFYSNLLKEPLKIDQFIQRCPVTVNPFDFEAPNSQQEISEEEVIKIEQPEHSIQDQQQQQPPQQQQQQQQQSKELGQFATFIATHFGNNEKWGNQKSIYSCKLFTEEQMKKEQKMNISHNHSNNNSNGSYRKTLFQSPQFRQESHEQSKGESPRSTLAVEQGRKINHGYSREAHEFQISFNPNFGEDSLEDE